MQILFDGRLHILGSPRTGCEGRWVDGEALRT